MKVVSTKLNEYLYSKLKEYSNVENKPISDCLFEAVAMFVNQLEDVPTEPHRFTFIDLCAGIGGMRLAFEKHGGKCVFASEIDRYCQRTYYENFGEFPKGDIRKIDIDDIPEHDILLASPPCQPFSKAGISKRNSLGIDTGFEDETSGTIFFDICRIIKAKRPKAILMENVKNLKFHDGGRTWEIIEQSLKDLEYEVYAEIINGKGFVPQSRERIFIVCFDKRRYDDVSFDFDCITSNDKKVLRDILDDDVPAKYTLSDKRWMYLQNYKEQLKEKKTGFGYSIADLDGSTRTLTSRYHIDGAEILIPQDGNPRKLTPRECARLQGFPDSFKIVVSDTQAYRQFGNAVIVPQVSAIAEKIVEKII